MLHSPGWMALPCYLGMDRILYEPFMKLARHACNLCAGSRWARFVATLAVGIARIAICMLPVHVFLWVPSSHVILILLVVADIFIHRFGDAADSIPPQNQQARLAIAFCRTMSLSQIFMLLATIMFALHSVRLQLWRIIL